MSFSSPTARPDDGLVLPDGAWFFTRWRVAVRALKVLEKKPDDGIAAPLFNASIDGARFAQLVDALAGTDDGRALLAARPSLQGSTVNLDALRALPDATLGRAFAAYFEQNRIQPFESPYEVRNDVDYLVKRYRETHDLAHVLTGYGTDPLGEMELQAFMLGNLGLRTSALILAFAAVLRPHGLPPMWRYAGRLKQAYARGKASRLMVSCAYEDFWNSTVDAVRERLAIPPLASSPALG